MKKSSVAAFVLATIVLCFQVVHFSYLKFFNPHESVLSDYLDKQIQQAKSLEELVAEYEKSLQAIELYEQQRPDADVLTYYQQSSIEPYKTKEKLEAAIGVWEKRSREYQRVWFQWTAGLILFTVGAVLFRMYVSWIPLAIHIAGMAEMIWWSSPTRMAVGAVLEYEKLINAKLLLTIVTLALVMLAWYWSERSQKKHPEGLS
jgi:hypothetical protein